MLIINICMCCNGHVQLKKAKYFLAKRNFIQQLLQSLGMPSLYLISADLSGAQVDLENEVVMVDVSCCLRSPLCLPNTFVSAGSVVVLHESKSIP